MSASFTNAEYVRTHGKNPKGTGGWAFQQSMSEVAFTADRFGPVGIYYGTLTEAKRAARESFPTAAAFIAVLG